jgi:hypothetical protein
LPRPGAALHASQAAAPSPVSDAVPWDTPHTVGQAFLTRPHLPAGTYTLRGTRCGPARVVITTDSALTWDEDLRLFGQHTGTKLTSPGGFTLSPLIL